MNMVPADKKEMSKMKSWQVHKVSPNNGFELHTSRSSMPAARGFLALIDSA
jgi:hypothetical protein